jgi:hypothetical protein
MRGLISDPTTSTQVEFNRLCELGGGVRGGPVRTRVCECCGQADKNSTSTLIANAYGYEVVREVDAHGEPVRGGRRIDQSEARRAESRGGFRERRDRSPRVRARRRLHSRA